MTGAIMLSCMAAACAVLSIHQLILFVVGFRMGRPPPNLCGGELPAYTVLVPLYRETAVLGQLVGAIDRLVYPRHLLDVKLLVEADDSDTLIALREMRLDPEYELLEIPAGEPRTKPRACNHGLDHARGEIVVVFDAEDIPEPDQLVKAVSAFSSAPSEVACFQARLGIWNPDTNALTRYVTARLCANFNVRRVGLERLDAPIPLGGTSNHFRTATLRRLGGWDAHNVAEDAELGIRLARAGYTTRFLDSWTHEEATVAVGNWLRQQSRWIKGFAQTWLTHCRHPVELVRDLGFSGAMHVQLTMLASILPVLLAPVLWAATLVWVLVLVGALAPPIPTWALAAAAASTALSTTVSTGGQVAALRRFGYEVNVNACVLFPLCELARSIAAAKGVAQLLLRPSYWEKTVHGAAART